MAGSYKFYKTKNGDRWDTLAYKFYGDVFRQQPIIEANPDVAITPILPAGITLMIPVMETTVQAQGLPIWKQ